MCGRYLSPDTAAIERAFHVGPNNGDANAFARRFNVLPTSDIPILRGVPDLQGFELCAARWGFIPFWWKQAKPPSHCFNARSEEAAGKPMWRDAWRKSRCLIPAEGWYEWQAAQKPDSKTGAIKPYKQPHFISSPDGQLLALAGLLSVRELPGEAPRLTCAIITRAAAPSVADVHERMPVILPAAQFEAWLSPKPRSADSIAAIIQTAQLDFKHHAVSTKLNSAKNDDKSLVEPV